MDDILEKLMADFVIGSNIVANKVFTSIYNGFVYLDEKYDIEERIMKSIDPDTNIFSISDSKTCEKPHLVDFEHCAEKVVQSVAKITFFQYYEDLGEIIITNGSGFIISKNLKSSLILTNAHVVASDYCRIEVELPNDKKLAARVSHVNDSIDLAIIEIDETNFPVLNFLLSDQLRTGQYVAGFGFPNSLKKCMITQGIVSSTKRKGKELGLTNDELTYIPFTAQVNIGNSGGPLADLSGNIVGIITYNLETGLSLAIPSERAMEFLKTINAKHQNIFSNEKKSTCSNQKSDQNFEMLSSNKTKEEKNLKYDQRCSFSYLDRDDQDNQLNSLNYFDHNHSNNCETNKSYEMNNHFNSNQFKNNQESFDCLDGGIKKRKFGAKFTEITGYILCEILKTSNSNKIKKGILLTDVKPGGVAEEIGFKNNDVIIELNSQEINSASEVKKIFCNKKSNFSLLLIRNGKNLKFDIEN